MRAEGSFNRKNPRGEASAVSAAGLGWQVRLQAVLLWTMEAAKRVAQGASATWVLEHDAALGLTSFEVWADEVCVYGVDDLG